MRSKHIVSDAMQQAAAWLADHNGTGVFAHDGVLLAGGERAPIMRVTWKRLCERGFVTIAAKRVTLTISGKEVAAQAAFVDKGGRIHD